VSEPGHAGRSYRIDRRAEHSVSVEPEQWLQQAPPRDGSWWTAWHGWLAAHSSPATRARAIPAAAALDEAPGKYVLQRYSD